MLYLTWIIPAFFWACSPSPATAAPAAALHRLGQIYVWAETLPADLGQDGLQGRRLVQQATEHLRQNEIPAQELLSDPGTTAQPYLAIEVTALKIPEINRYVYSLALHVKQRVALVRDPTRVTSGSTWHIETVGLVHVKNASTKIEEALGDLLDQFIDAYVATNPLPSRPPTPTPAPAPGF